MAARSIRAFHECVAYTTQTFDERRGFNFLRFITGLFVVTLVAGVAAGGVMLSPLSNAARGLTFHSSVVDRGSLITLAPGSTASVTLRFRNSGLTAWERGSDAQVDLGVKNDSVEFAKAGMAVGWLTENRIATTAESVVPPGAVGSFTFEVRAPTKLGIYRIPVRLVVDDVTWLEDQDTFISVASDFGFHGELIDQTEHPTLRAGETRAVTVRLLRFAMCRLGHLFPYLPKQPGYNKRCARWRRRSCRLLEAPRVLLAVVVRQRALAGLHPGAVRPIARDGRAIGVRRLRRLWLVRSHSRYFWGFRLYLLCAPMGCRSPSSSPPPTCPSATSPPRCSPRRSSRLHRDRRQGLRRRGIRAADGRVRRDLPAPGPQGRTAALRRPRARSANGSNRCST